MDVGALVAEFPTLKLFSITLKAESRRYAIGASSVLYPHALASLPHLMWIILDLIVRLIVMRHQERGSALIL